MLSCQKEVKSQQSLGQVAWGENPQINETRGPASAFGLHMLSSLWAPSLKGGFGEGGLAPFWGALWVSDVKLGENRVTCAMTVGHLSVFRGTVALLRGHSCCRPCLIRGGE